MSDDPGDSREFDSERWTEFTREQLPIGSSAEWEFPAIGRVVGVFGDSLELRPVAILRRFQDSEETIIGGRLLQFDSQRRKESSCLLTCEEFSGLWRITACESSSGIESPPARFQMRTRFGFSLEIVVHNRELLVFASAACNRVVQLPLQEWGKLRECWMECRDFWRDRSL